VLCEMERDFMASVDCPYGQRGSVLIVKQDFLACREGDESGTVKPSQATYVIFRDGTRVDRTGENTGRVTPSDGVVRHWGEQRFRLANFLPRWACPLALEVIDVVREGVQEIRGCDAEEEGFCSAMRQHGLMYGVNGYAAYFRERHGTKAWDANKDVWVIRFKPLSAVPVVPSINEHSIVFLDVFVNAIRAGLKVTERRIVQ
jgi:hypothetical protein